MKFSAIATVAANGVIGGEGAIPWQGMASGERQLFKRHTIGKAVVMGRATWESIPEKPLPLRLNIVLTTHQLHDFNCIAAPNVSDALELVMAEKFYDEVIFIGGQQVYEEALPKCSTLYLTELEGIFPGDRYFPELDMGGWEIEKEEYYPLLGDRRVAYTFKVLKRLYQ